jgi:formate dehydrogenase assembly factor FdhD
LVAVEVAVARVLVMLADIMAVRMMRERSDLHELIIGFLITVKPKTPETSPNMARRKIYRP